MAAKKHPSARSRKGYSARDPLIKSAKSPSKASSRPLDALSEFSWGASETQTVKPGGRVTWFVRGPDGAQVSFRLTRVEGSGGHHDHRTSGPLGEVSPRTIRLVGAYPQNVPVVYTAPTVAGLVKIEFIFSDGSIDVDYNAVREEDLFALHSSGSIVLVGATAHHPDNHYGTAGLIRAIQTLARLFYGRFGKPLAVNDMSLVWGGVFDINGDWRPPHSTHNIGRHADIRSKDMNEEEKKFFLTAAKDARLRATLEFADQTNEHWHVVL